uniref:Uncharacterized protein n=1 Tax=Physcomitrium patens TaxID=3218 RepID=A0A2K1KMI0_PHYPA|nr:hypothetical protein PHYPA_005869 [Physcomitrium patens]
MSCPAHTRPETRQRVWENRETPHSLPSRENPPHHEDHRNRSKLSSDFLDVTSKISVPEVDDDVNTTPTTTQSLKL